jgi:RimJ/RimL family protein N-acetyltransferase
MEFETQRLILREFKVEDWAEVLAYQSDPRYMQFYTFACRSVDNVKDFIQMFLDQQEQQPRTKFQLAVTLKSNGRLIGNCGVRLEKPDALKGDIGYEMSPEHWGQGYATEAARMMVDFGFVKLHLHRIWAECVADNQRSVRVLKKLGMRLEGRLRENHYFRGQWWDTLVFGLLAEEWTRQGRMNENG